MPAISPNPAKNTLNIQSKKVINVVSVYDMQGRMLKQYLPNSNSSRIDISKFSSGFYFIKIQCGETEYLRKIEKK